jgi:hypothetical protein
MLAEEEIVRGDGTLEIGFAHVVQIDAAAFDIFSGLSLGRTETGVDKEFDQRYASAFEFGFFQVLGGNFADDVIEGGFGNAREFTAEKNFAGSDGFGGGLFTVDEIGHGFREGLMSHASAWIGGVLLLKRRDFIAGQECEKLQVTNDVAVIGVDPKLVEAIDAGLFGIDPDSTRHALAEFGAIGIGDKRECETEDLSTKFFAAEITAGGNVAPLIAAADLQFAIKFLAQMVEIERLEQHVAEFSVADAGFAVFHAGADAFLGNHHVYGEMLADFPEELQVADGCSPGIVVEQTRGICLGVEIEQSTELHLDVGDVGIEHFLGKELALYRFATGVADGTGCTAGKGDGDVAEELEASEGDKGDEIADVEAVRRRVESGVQGDGTGFEPFQQFDLIRAIGQQTAPFQFFVNVHSAGESYAREGEMENEKFIDGNGF